MKLIDSITSTSKLISSLLKVKDNEITELELIYNSTEEKVLKGIIIEELKKERKVEKSYNKN